MSEDNEITIKKVKSNYKPYLALALCWTDDRAKGLFYNYIQPSFANHPCDLFDRKGNREEWKYLNEDEESIKGKIETVLEDKEKEKLIKEHFKILLPKKAEFLRDNIAGSLQVSNFGRVGIPINCKGKSGLCKGCEDCKLNPKNTEEVSIALEKTTNSVKKCEKFHFILSQYESLCWNNSQQEFETYNGYLVVNINGKERLVYELVSEAFKMKEETFQKMKEDNKDFIDYIKEKCGYGDDDEENLKKAFKELKDADKLQIHHIDNNGHHNTPTYWNEYGTMIKGNLIALPEKVHQKIHGKSLKLSL